MKSLYRHISTFIMIVLGVQPLWAIEKSELMTVAENYAAILGRSIQVKNLNPIVSDIDTLAWFISLSQGFIILSNQKEIQPLIAYNFEDTFTLKSDNYRLFSSIIKRDIMDRKVKIQDTKNKNTFSKNVQLWNTAMVNSKSSDLSESMNKSVQETYFLDTPQWGQGNVGGVPLFNMYTPNNWAIGCVGTALAEILAYYQWPTVGVGSHYYSEDDAGVLLADFGTTNYQLEKALHNYSSQISTSTEKYIAAKVSYHSAISLDMDFEYNGSTASTSNADNSLRDYFRFDASYSSSSLGLFDNLENDIKKGNPGIIALDGDIDHSVVVDGYSDLNGFFHLNMGWNGEYNAWYDIRESFTASGYGNATVIGGVHSILPNPMILNQNELTSKDSVILNWIISPLMNADYYDLQLKINSGEWQTLNASVSDSSYINYFILPGDYSFRIRANYNGSWSGYSEAYTVQYGDDIRIQFHIDLVGRTLDSSESVILVGNFPPLGSIQNSPVFIKNISDYTTLVEFDNQYVGDTLLYRFGISNSSSYELESENRALILETNSEIQDVFHIYNDVFTGIEELFNIPETFTLMSAYPNPFNNRLQIDLKGLVPGTNHCLTIYNLLGKHVETIDIEPGAHSEYSLSWDSQNCPSGIYLIEFNNQTQKVVLIK